MIRRIVLGLFAFGALTLSSLAESHGGVIVRRVAPVRRVAARAVLPPYPVARRAVVGPVYRPVVAPYRGPVLYGPGVSVFVGY